MEVKDILKNQREKLGYTMKELAQKVGVSEGTISRWESGEIANMKRDKIVALAHALELSPAVVMGWEAPENQPYYLSDEAREYAQFLFDNPEYKVLFDASRSVKKEDIEFVKQMIDRMTKE